MKIRYPIILAQGICPFDALFFLLRKDNAADDRYHYFRKIRSTLLSHGFTAFHSRVSWGAELDRRAKDLRSEILKVTDHFSKHPKVHIIAHSMGGLDSRRMIYKYRMEDRVASLTTIGTPHLGSSFANRGIAESGWIIQTAEYLGLNIRGIKDLTTEACAERNRAMRDFEANNGVLYQTVAGVQPHERIFSLLKRSHKMIWEEEGENDGLVSLKSAVWDENRCIKVIDADHLNQIGWWHKGQANAGLDRKGFEKRIQGMYLEIAGNLKDD